MRLKVVGNWTVKHIRDGQILTEFTKNNALTRRGILDLFSRSCSVTGITATDGNPLEDFLAIFWWHMFLINDSGFTALSRADAIEYRDGTGTLVQGDNRQWSSGPNIRSGENFNFNNDADGAVIFETIPTRGDTVATSIEKYRADSNEDYRGVWMFYERNRSISNACVAVCASFEFPAVINMRKFDYLEVTYELSFTIT